MGTLNFFNVDGVRWGTAAMEQVVHEGMRTRCLVQGVADHRADKLSFFLPAENVPAFFPPLRLPPPRETKTEIGGGKSAVEIGPAKSDEMQSDLPDSIRFEIGCPISNRAYLLLIGCPT